MFDGLVYAGRNFLAEDGGPPTPIPEEEESSDAEEDDRDEEDDEDNEEEPEDVVEVPMQLDDEAVDGELRPWDLCFAWCPLLL